jgi:acetylornithine deacetylase/succinyl-diaminopimelate desuccinylase-like protein
VTLREEVTALLQELIRVDTTNPPGNETAAAELLRDYLEPNGVRCELVAKTPERANLVARIPGSGDGPRLMLLSHTDVVLADPGEWTVPPFAGELRDGMVWGRGALDMKGQVAASAVAIASLAREGFEPRGDLVFAAVADEEVGSDFGLAWLCREHPEVVRCEYAINEGSGERVELAGRALYLCATAEKAASPFLLRVRGRAGHASMPAIADNALVKAAPLIERLAAIQPEPRLQPEMRALLAALLGEVPAAGEALDRVRRIDPFAAELLQPLLAATFAPTRIQASEKQNVVPALCELTVDCRLLPGQAREEAELLVREALGDAEGAVELEWLELHGGTRSPLETPLWTAVESFVEQIEPGAVPVPMCCAGFTDSHWLREAFGTVAYGFFPARAMGYDELARLVHSADERVPVDDLELGLDFLRHAARAVCG